MNQSSKENVYCILWLHKNCPIVCWHFAIGAVQSMILKHPKISIKIMHLFRLTYCKWEGTISRPCVFNNGDNWFSYCYCREHCWHLLAYWVHHSWAYPSLPWTIFHCNEKICIFSVDNLPHPCFASSSLAVFVNKKVKRHVFVSWLISTKSRMLVFSL